MKGAGDIGMCLRPRCAADSRAKRRLLRCLTGVAGASYSVMLEPESGTHLVAFRR